MRSDEGPKVSGTWDFKWAAGTSLRVAFLASEERSEQIERIAEIARQWEVRPHLSIEFLKDRVPKRPQPSKSALSKEEVIELRRARARWEDALTSKVSYQVLVSLEPLPAYEFPEDPFDRVRATRFVGSKLGAYATRVDYGVPTLHLGPVEEEDRRAPDAYFRSDKFIYHVFHGFCHVVGLPHAHQHPLLEPIPWNAGIFRHAFEAIEGKAAFQSWLAAKPLLSKRGAFDTLSLTEVHTAIGDGDCVEAKSIKAYVEHSVQQLWPATLDKDGKTVMFSDWFDASSIQHEDGCPKVESVTLHPYWWNFVGSPNVPKNKDTTSFFANLHRGKLPEFDRQWIRALYS